MKTLHYIKTCALLGAIAVSASSCEDYLTIEEVENRTIVTDYYDSPQKVEQAVIGAYVELRLALLDNHAWLMYGDVRAGDVVLDVAHSQQVANQELNSTVRAVSQLQDWTHFYAAVKNANKSLEIIEAAQNGILTTAQYKLYKGEMLAVKSLAYFYLTRIWGAVPSAEKAELGSLLQPEAMMNQLEAWVREARELLPWKLLNDDGIVSESLTLIRFNKTAASLLLADVQLSAGKGADAHRELSLLRNDIPADSLTSFALSLGKNSDAQIPQDPYSNRNIGLTTEKFNTIYPLADSRRSKFNVRTDGQGANLIMDAADNLMIYPLREVNLILAESAWRAGELAMAKSYLLEAAAGATEDYTLLDAQTFADALLKERQRLLIGLGKRMFDLHRFNRIPEFIPFYNVTDLQNGAAFWPLSARSISDNGLEQNAYWSK